MIRLDYKYQYPPAPGDIDHPDSFGYDVMYLEVPGLTFEMCQSGRLTHEVQARFIHTVAALDQHGVDAITGDCGFMMYLQPLARQYTRLPVFLSSLVQLPAVVSCHAPHELVAILTANSRSLEPMRGLIRHECGIDLFEQLQYRRRTSNSVLRRTSNLGPSQDLEPRSFARPRTSVLCWCSERPAFESLRDQS